MPYSVLVWVKLGNYRFWPSQVVSLDNIPATLANKDHQVGDFPVKFFGELLLSTLKKLSDWTQRLVGLM